MASLELGPLSNFLEEEEIRTIHGVLEDHGAPHFKDGDDDSHLIEASLDEDLLADFMDQLEANEAGCEYYLPVEFEDVLDAAGYRVGSAHALLLALANMRDDMGIDEDDDDEIDDDADSEDYDEMDDGAVDIDDEPSAIDLKDQHMRHLWRAFHRGATAAITRNLVLVVQR
jgi:hypothetical protein